VFAERWTPLVLRELGAGVEHFNELVRGCRGISPSVLGERLEALAQRRRDRTPT
jgi:DNA-binding HxlR family transcriptional regulator